MARRAQGIASGSAEGIAAVVMVGGSDGWRKGVRAYSGIVGAGLVDWLLLMVCAGKNYFERACERMVSLV